MFKKIDIYLLKQFLGLLTMTFLICVFILLMQFVWMHVKDLVGKGVELSVLMEFFVYAVASVVPLALPLAILLASLMTFGNLGEKFELTAMKAAGVSLFRIMRPLAIAIAFVCVGAFMFSNYVLPVSQVKFPRQFSRATMKRQRKQLCGIRMFSARTTIFWSFWQRNAGWQQKIFWILIYMFITWKQAVM